MLQRLAPYRRWVIEGAATRRGLSVEQRVGLRLLVDAARRQQIDWHADPRCRGCGVELIDRWTGEERYVAGCATCSDRRGKRRTRTSMNGTAGAKSSVHVEAEASQPVGALRGGHVGALDRATGSRTAQAQAPPVTPRRRKPMTVRVEGGRALNGAAATGVR
jgi:hypothetical protein